MEHLMQTKPINAPGVQVPTSGYSQALEVKDHSRILFISGQTPTKPDGTTPEGFAAQCRLAWQNITAQLQEAGMTLDNLVMHRTYLADRAYRFENRAIRNEVLAGRQPALTVVVADIFDAAWLLEIEAVAVA
jgi:enamine deaminase RidA (YjgF/YER057c/UK114 family)